MAQNTAAISVASNSFGPAGRFILNRVVWPFTYKIRPGFVILKSLDTIRQFFELLVGQQEGHFRALGMSVVAIDRDRLGLLLPYSDRIVGNPDSGVVHGGCLTALLDTCCGFAAATVLDELCLCPTIDLRIDYMGTAKPGESIVAEAEVIHITPHILFTRGIAYQGDPENPVARCSANFLRLGASVVGNMQKQFETLLRSADQ